MKRNIFLVSSMVIVLVAVAVAINVSGARSGGTSKISYTGSSTIGDNIVPDAFPAFAQKTGVEIGTIESPGSGLGIEAVIQGKALLAGASRPLNADEEQQHLYKQVIGYDAIVVFVNKKNPVRALTKAQIKAIFTGKINNWREVGGKDAPIAVITETLSAKRATMVEFQKLAMDGGEYLSDRREVDKPTDQVALLQEQEGGIISVSLAFDAPGIKAVSINNISPDPDNVRSGAYLFSRPLILVTAGQPQNEMADFFTFMLSSEGQAIVNKKFVGL